MKLIRQALYIIVTALVFLFPQKTLAEDINWYAGAERPPLVDGITALISAPHNPLDLIHSGSSGEANWVSTFDEDVNGRDWIQAGWLIYHWQDTPWQYVEWCIDCHGDYGTYFISPFYAFHNWGTTLSYWVYRVYGATSIRWCGSTGGYQRYCVNNLHSSSVMVLAKSEVHYYSKNSLDTMFSQVKYLDPVTRIWTTFDNVLWIDDFPYAVYVYTDDHFWNFRIPTHDAFLPFVINGGSSSE